MARCHLAGTQGARAGALACPPDTARGTSFWPAQPAHLHQLRQLPACVRRQQRSLAAGAVEQLHRGKRVGRGRHPSSWRAASAAKGFHVEFVL